MKAILVIDMPYKCSECAFRYDNKDNKMSCYIDDYIKDCKGDCPLKPLSRFKNPNGSDIFNDYVRGYNDCLREILGETDDRDI